MIKKAKISRVRVPLKVNIKEDIHSCSAVCFEPNACISFFNVKNAI
jgi:hypothetical protein